MRVHRGGCRGLVTALVLAGLGCGGRGIKPVPFDGLVTLDDKPLAGAVVEFIPLDQKGRAAVGVSDKQGVFRLTTASPGDGAMPGFYKVRVTKDTGDDDDTASPPRQPTSKAEAMELYIKKGKQMARGQAKARQKPLFPAMYSDPNKTPLRCQVPPEGKAVLALQGS